MWNARYITDGRLRQTDCVAFLSPTRSIFQVASQHARFSNRWMIKEVPHNTQTIFLDDFELSPRTDQIGLFGRKRLIAFWLSLASTVLQSRWFPCSRIPLAFHCSPRLTVLFAPLCQYLFCLDDIYGKQEVPFFSCFFWFLIFQIKNFCWTILPEMQLFQSKDSQTLLSRGFGGFLRLPFSSQWKIKSNNVDTKEHLAF